MKSFIFIIKMSWPISFKKPIGFGTCSYEKEIMDTTILAGDTISYFLRDSVLFLNEIDPLGDDISNDNGSRVYNTSKVLHLGDINLELYHPQNTKGPDPSEEEQRDRSNKEKINAEEDQHKEKPDHSEEDIYGADSDQKEKDKKNSLN